VMYTRGNDGETIKDRRYRETVSQPSMLLRQKEDSTMRCAIFSAVRSETV
jgi:hypothetical protein